MLADPTEGLYYKKNTRVRSGQGLYQAMREVSVLNDKALEIINALRDEVEFSKLKVGDELSAKFDVFHRLVEFSFSQNTAEKHLVTYNYATASWDYRFETLPTEWSSRIIEGELRPGSTLHSDLFAYGLSAATVNEVVQVLLCKVNFRMHARMGDRFKIFLRERRYKQEVIETKVLYTSYAGVRAGSHEAFYYEDEEKKSTYSAHYTEDGQALISSGLRYPLSRLHVRSGYGMRMHPVTGRRTMHRGIDLRASRGRPVHAVAAGKVVVSAYNKYAGNKVAIRHSDGSTSYYLHLNKRSAGLGQWVRSHQVIGTVGSTGRVTGPHLHFGFKDHRGRWMNPLNKRMIATPKLKGRRFDQLQLQIAQIRGHMIDFKLKNISHYLLSDQPSYELSLYERFQNDFSPTI